MIRYYRQRFEHYGHGTAEQAIVGLGGQVFMRRNSQDAINEFRPYFDKAPVYGHGPSLADFMAGPPPTVGSSQQVLERTLALGPDIGSHQQPGMPSCRERMVKAMWHWVVARAF